MTIPCHLTAEVTAIQRLLVTCQIQSVNPYAYLVDALQRNDRRPVKRIINAELVGWFQPLGETTIEVRVGAVT